jgi:hypothetical protein
LQNPVTGFQGKSERRKKESKYIIERHRERKERENKTYNDRR